MSFSNEDFGLLKVFTSSDLPSLAEEIGKSLKLYLQQGSTTYLIPGLNHEDAPVYIVQEGAEGLEPYIIDENNENPEEYNEYENRPLAIRPKVFFFDDISQVSLPYIKITSVFPESNLLDWDTYTYISNWHITVDIVSGESTGTVSEGEDPKNSESILGGYVYRILGKYEGMKEYGITNYELKPKAQRTEAGKAGPLSHSEIDITAEIYSLKDRPYHL